MKKKKIICLIFVLVGSGNLFALGGFEGIVNVPLGAALSFKTYSFNSSLISADEQTKIKDNTKADIGFESGVYAQLGYRFELKNMYSLSILAEIGYSYDFLGYINKVDDKKYFYWFNTHSIAIGVLPKLNINNFSIGLGAGVKLPLKADYYEADGKKGYQLSEANTYYASLTRDDLKNTVFKSLVIPYLKLTFDYSLAVHEKLAVNFGIYTGYDFNIKGKEINNYEKWGLSSFNFGAQFGLKFSQNKKNIKG